MGQTMLEGCEMECQKIGIQQKQRSRSDVYFSNMGAQLPEFTYDEAAHLRRSKATVVKNNEFLMQLNLIPSYYVEYINYLFVENKKFEDTVFPATVNSIIWGGTEAENDWARISDMTQEIAIIYRNYQYSGKAKTKIIEILQIIEENFSGSLENIKPIYIKKVGLAICYLYINGNREEVIVDDLIPTSHLRNYTQANSWYFLVEKAFAKLIGNYAFAEEFSLPELFQQITGLPFEVSKRKGEGWLNRDSSVKLTDANLSSFKDVIEDQTVRYLEGGSENSQVYKVRTIPGHQLRSFPYQNGIHSVSLYKIQVSKSQKVSIRISYLNPKFLAAQVHKNYVESQMVLYRQSSGYYTQIEKDSTTLGNNLYLGCPFMKLIEGQYVLYVKRDNQNDRASLVCYVGEGIKIKQIHSKQICNDLLKKLKKYQRK